MKSIIWNKKGQTITVKGKEVKLIDYLFSKFDGIYQHKFRSAFTCADSVKNWAEAWEAFLVEEKMSLEKIGLALKLCVKKYDWCPSLPEFLRLCKCPIDAEEAFTEAVKQLSKRKLGEDKWSHPQIFWAAQAVGEFEMMSQSYQVLKDRWQKALENEFAKEEIEPIPDVLVTLPSQKITQKGSAESKKRIGEMVSVLRKKVCIE